MSDQSFGKFQLKKKLATGGMAEVWLAKQRGIEGFSKNLVVKRILPHLAEDREFVQMFRHEAMIAARFNHPNIAQVYEFGEANGAYFIAMEFIRGEDLGRVMRKAWSTGQWVARPLAIRIIAACCEGLYYAHTQSDDEGRPLKVVHRDISPQNILISFDGSVKLVDFGIAKAADQASLTKSGAIKGKFAYMAPEQASGKPLDHRSDIFAIGLVLYELITGVRPLKRDSEIATLQAALECKIESPSQVADVPSELDEVVMRALTKNVDERYRDARQFQVALEDFLVGQRWMASSVQISELMATLFSDRLEEEKRLGDVAPATRDGSPSVDIPAAESSLGEDRTAHRKDKSPPVADMKWEAPPGVSNNTRTGSKSAQRSVSMERAPQVTDAVPAWEAPQGTMDVPRRRTSDISRVASTGNETAIARTPSKVDVPRSRSLTSVPAKPAPTRTAVPDPDDRDEAPARSARSLREEDDRHEAEQDDRELDEAEEPAPIPRTRSSTQAPRTASKNIRRTVTGNLAKAMTDEGPALADAPPRSSKSLKAKKPVERRKSTRNIPVQAVDDALSAPIDEVIDVELEREQSRQRLKRVLKASIFVAVVALIAIFHEPIVKFFNSRAQDDGNYRDIFLTVKSNIPVKVSVKHFRDENNKEPVTELGDAPLTHRAGAHLRDTIVLENKELGAYYEQEIPFGEPRETLPIEKDFRHGRVKFEIRPATLEGAALTENGFSRGEYKHGQTVELLEGKHTLQLESDAMDAPCKLGPFEVKPGQTLTYDLDCNGRPAKKKAPATKAEKSDQ